MEDENKDKDEEVFRRMIFILKFICFSYFYYIYLPKNKLWKRE